MADLTLNDDGPTPETLTEPSGGAIHIINNTGGPVTITMSNAGLINPSTGTTLTVPTTGLDGTVGSASGTYSYSAGAELAVRSGTIDINK